MSEYAALGLKNVEYTAGGERIDGVCLLTDKGRVLFKGNNKEVSFLRNSCKIRNHPKKPMTQVRYVHPETQAELLSTWNFASATVLPNNNTKWAIELEDSPSSIQKVFFEFLQGTLCAIQVNAEGPNTKVAPVKPKTDEISLADSSLSMSMSFMKTHDILDVDNFILAHKLNLSVSVRSSNSRRNDEGCALKVPPAIMTSLKESGRQDDGSHKDMSKTSNRKAAMSNDHDEDVLEFLEELFREFPQLKKHYEEHIAKDMVREEYLSRLIHSPFFAVINNSLAPMSVWRSKDSFIAGLPDVTGSSTLGLREKLNKPELHNRINRYLPIDVRLDTDLNTPGQGICNIKEYKDSYHRRADVVIEEKNSTSHILETVFERLNRHSVGVVNEATLDTDESDLIELLKSTEEGTADKFTIKDEKPTRMAALLKESSKKIKDRLHDELLTEPKNRIYNTFKGMAVKYRIEERTKSEGGTLLLYQDYERPHAATYEFVSKEHIEKFYLITRVGIDKYKELYPGAPILINEEIGLYDVAKCQELLHKLVSQNLEGSASFGRRIQQLGLSQMYRKANITAKHIARSKELNQTLDKQATSYDEALVLYLEEFANIQRKVANVLRVCWNLSKSSLTPTVIAKWMRALTQLKEEVSEFQLSSRIVQFKPGSRRLLNRKTLCNNLIECLNMGLNELANKERGK